MTGGAQFAIATAVTVALVTSGYLARTRIDRWGTSLRVWWAHRRYDRATRLVPVPPEPWDWRDAEVAELEQLYAQPAYNRNRQP